LPHTDSQIILVGQAGAVPPAPLEISARSHGAKISVPVRDAVWYQKWFVHLRPRQEEIGGLVRLIKTGHGN